VDNVDSDDENENENEDKDKDDGCEDSGSIPEALGKKPTTKTFNSRTHQKWRQTFSNNPKKQLELCQEWRLAFESFFQLGSAQVCVLIFYFI